MLKEIFTGFSGGVIVGAGGVIVIEVIVATVKQYLMNHNDDQEIERVFVDELNMGEIKKWFAENITGDSMVGVLLLPTKENIAKWKIKKMPSHDNVLVQLVYNEAEEQLVSYREVGYAEIGEKVKELLEANDGMIVIEK